MDDNVGRTDRMDEYQQHPPVPMRRITRCRSAADHQYLNHEEPGQALRSQSACPQLEGAYGGDIQMENLK